MPLNTITKEEIRAWIKGVEQKAKAKMLAREQQGGPLLGIFNDLGFAAGLITCTVEEYLEDLGLPRDIDELLLVNTAMSEDGPHGYPLYTVQVPNRNVELFLRDVHCTGEFDVYSAWTLDGRCFPPNSCSTCAALAALDEAASGRKQ